MDIEEVERCLQYNNADERDVLKQFFTNPPQLDTSRKTIVFSTPSETGTSYFRLFEPMKALWRHYRDEANFIYTECLQPNHMVMADCIIMHRAGNLHSHFVTVKDVWPKTKKRPLIIHDVDDNEFNLPRRHPMAELWYASGKDKMSLQALKRSDLVTTTTEKLRKTFRRFNDDVHIFRNQFDWTLPQWNLNRDEVRKEMCPKWFANGGDDKIVIGCAGLTSHFEDIKRMHASIKAIHDKYPNTVFVLAGMALKDSQVEIEYVDGKPKFNDKPIEDENLRYRNRVIALYDDIDPDRLMVFDALPLEEYAKFYTLFDISLAYIEHNAFNSCKSEIKVIESLHYNCIPVFTSYGGYEDFWKSVPKNVQHDHMAIGGSSPRLWTSAIEFWINKLQDDPGYVKNVMANLVAFSDNEYDINLGAEARLEFLLQQTESFEEEQMNNMAQYSDYYGE